MQLTERQKQIRKLYRDSPNGKLTKYKSNAKERGINFNLEFEFFNSLLNLNCHYCGKENANGVDRIDSSKDYQTDNVVPCCKTCNQMKMALSYETFLKQIKLIYSNLL